MARRPRLVAPGLLYHVIARGNQRQKTFLTDHDYQVYLERLAKYRKRCGVALYAYCLMPNQARVSDLPNLSDCGRAAASARLCPRAALSPESLGGRVATQGI